MSTPVVTLAALVVTYNRRAHIKVTVDRVLAQGVDHLVVVDNGSDDGTGDWLAALDDTRLTVLTLPENRGGAGGFEAGLTHIAEQIDPDWVVVMDDDARPHPGALDKFRNSDLQGRDAVAAAVYYPDGRVCEMNRPGLNPFWHWGTFLKTLGNILRGGGRNGFHICDEDYAPHNPPRFVDIASFVGLFLSRRALELAGRPDGRMFIYADDTLYTLGLTKAGGRIAFTPEITFEHDCSTLGPNEARIYTPLWKAFYTYRNGLMMYRRAAGVFFIGVLPIVLLKWLFNGRRYGAKRQAYYQLLRWAVWDGLRGDLTRRVHELEGFD